MTTSHDIHYQLTAISLLLAKLFQRQLLSLISVGL